VLDQFNLAWISEATIHKRGKGVYGDWVLWSPKKISTIST